MDPDAPSFTYDGSGDDGLKDDSGTTNEARVRACETSVWVRTQLVNERRGDTDLMVLYGRASRDLVGGMAFVSDDRYGNFQVISTRRFEVSWSRDELASLMYGVNLFLRLDLKHSSSRPDTLYVRVVAAPRLRAFTGTGLILNSDTLPVMVGGRPVVRLEGTATEKLYDLHVLIGDTTWVPSRKPSEASFQADLTADQALALVGSETEIFFAPHFLDGPAEKRARLGLFLWKLDLTDQDPYQVFPTPACTAELLACLQALPADTLDLSSCGRVRAVQACAGQMGVVVDNPQVIEARVRAQARIDDSAGFGSDAVALIGTERLPVFRDQVQAWFEERLVALYGLWFLSEQARQRGIDAEIESLFDQVYATPLDFVDELAPIPGDPVRTRALAADSLLQYIAGFDFVHSEFDQPLVDVTRSDRTWHVDSLRYFREQAEAFPSGAFDVFSGNWLSPAVEIWMDRTTGTVDHLIFQID